MPGGNQTPVPLVSLIPAGRDLKMPRLSSARNEYDVEHRRRGINMKYRVLVTDDYPKTVIHSELFRLRLSDVHVG
jgi:hypothetical protein